MESSNRGSFMILGSLFLLSPSLYIIFLKLNNNTIQNGLYHRLLIGFMSFITSLIFIPKIAIYTEKKGLYGKDLGKKFIPNLRDVKVPEVKSIFIFNQNLFVCFFLLILLILTISIYFSL